jgi:16S rRNA (guanine527-N7)-methyltransferase
MVSSLLSKYFELNPLQINQFEQLELLIKDWNEKINLVSRNDIENLTERHILHSLIIAKLADIKSGDTILDIGTGGGFPGIPLAVMFPEAQFTLIDSIGKKIKVVKDLIEALKLKNVNAIHVHSNELKGKFDIITGRAVTRLLKFVNMSEHLLAKDGRYCVLKGGNLEEEIQELIFETGLPVKKIPVSDTFEEDFFHEKYFLTFKP